MQEYMGNKQHITNAVSLSLLQTKGQTGPRGNYSMC